MVFCRCTAGAGRASCVRVVVAVPLRASSGSKSGLTSTSGVNSIGMSTSSIGASTEMNVPETPSLPLFIVTTLCEERDHEFHFALRASSVRAGFFVLDFQYGFAAVTGVSNGHSATRTKSAKAAYAAKGRKTQIWQFTEISILRCL